MTTRFWLTSLESTDPAFLALQRAEVMVPPEDWPVLELSHKQAVLQAAFGKTPEQLEQQAEELREFAARQAERDYDGLDADRVHYAEVEALGFALGITAAQYAIRVHDQLEQPGVGVAA